MIPTSFPIRDFLILIALLTLPATIVAETSTGVPTAKPETPAQSGSSAQSAPSASRLLPEDTLAYIRIRDVDDLREGFQRTSLGKMLDDPAMRPFISDSFTAFEQTFEELASEFGMSLGDLLAIPQGQFAAALLPGAPEEATDANAETKSDKDLTDDQIKRRLRRRRREQNSFAGVFLIETGIDNQSSDSMREALTRIEQLAEKNESVRRVEKIGDHEIIRWVRQRGRSSVIEWFDRDGMFVIGIGNQSATDVLRRWNETDVSKNRKQSASKKSDTSTLAVGTLSSNSDFASVMTRCIGAEADVPQITFYTNPFAIAQRIIRRSSSSFFIQPIVESLGVAKIRGIGGSVFRGGDLIENILHLHVVIDPPRDGFFGIVRPEEVEPTPPNWIPAKITSYTTLNWDVATALDNLSEIVNRFAGQGAFERFTEDRVKSRLDVSIRDDLVANWTGRFVSMRRYQSPAAWNAVARATAFQVLDPAKTTDQLKRAKTQLPPGDIKTEKIDGVEVHFIRSQTSEGRELPETIRRPERSVMLLGDYLIVSDSREIVQAILQAHAGSVDRLVDDSDYALMASELGLKLEREKPFFLSFNRDAESYRVFYEMASSPASARLMQQRAEKNDKLRRFADLLKNQKLPDFDELRRYFSVSGGFAYDEPGGLHFGALNLVPLE